MTASLLRSLGTLLSMLADLSNAVVWDGFLYILQFVISSAPFGDHSKCTNYDWYYCHFHYYHHITSHEFFFMSVLADDFLLVSESQQVSSGLQDFSQYSG